MKIILQNWFHSGDIILSRAILSDVLPLLRAEGHDVGLRCQRACTYLWSDLGADISDSQIFGRDSAVVDLWFGIFPDVLQSMGLTSANQTETWNRQAADFKLPLLQGRPRRDIVLPAPTVAPPRLRACVLVENGPVLSGQPCWDLAPSLLAKMADENPGWTFACSADPGVTHPRLLDCSAMDLRSLSEIGAQATAIVSKLSGVTVACYTIANRNKPRIVAGSPMPYPIWDEDGFVYVDDSTTLLSTLRKTLATSR